MTYAVGQLVLAADDLGGPIASTSAYASDLAATDKVSALIGVGYGSRGYGQTSPVILPIVSGSAIPAVHMNAVITALGLINTHTGSGQVLPASIVAGDPVQAFDGSSSRPNLPVIISALDTARLTFSVGQMTLTSVLTGTRTDPWNTSVYHEFTATFANENEARYFFNTGSQIYTAASRTGGTNNHIDVALTDLLIQMGTIKIGAVATTYTGTGGTAYPIGYYGLTTSYQTLFVHNGATYGYTTVSYTLRAKVESVSSVNGGNGSVLRIQAVFATGYSGGSYGHGVDGTLISSVSQLNAGGVLMVTAPTYASGAPYNNPTF